MDDFFDKIKKKLSVDNILEFMKDGKLKEEIKQTLTGKVHYIDQVSIPWNKKKYESDKKIKYKSERLSK